MPTKTPHAITRDELADELRERFPTPTAVALERNDWNGIDVRVVATGDLCRVVPVDGSFENGVSIYIVQPGRARLVTADLTVHGLAPAGVAHLARTFLVSATTQDSLA